MILRISKMLVMMALPIMLIACGGETSGVKQSDSGMRFVLAPGQTLPTGVTVGDKEDKLDFGEVNFVGVEKGPIKFNLKNIKTTPVNFTKSGLVGGNKDVFITASSCFKTLAAGDSCDVTVTFSPLEQDRSYKDDYAVEFYFGNDANDQAFPVKLPLSARTFAGKLVDVEGVPGLSVSGNYQELAYDNITVGTTSAPLVVNYFYFGEGEVTLSAKEAMISADVSSTGTNPDREIFTDSTCGLMKYGDNCIVQLFYRPAVPSDQLGANVYSHIPVKISGGDLTTVKTSTIVALKDSSLPANSKLMKITDVDGADIASHVSLTETPLAGQISNNPVPLKLVRTDAKAEIKKLFYRLESTNPAIVVNRYECDLVLKNKDDAATPPTTGDCKFNVYFSPSDAGEQAGYIMVSAGKERYAVRVVGTATAGTATDIDAGGLANTATAINALTISTGIDTVSLSKRIKVQYKPSSAALPFTMDVVTTDKADGKGLFTYTTTCVEGKALDIDNSSCYVDVTFRGGSAAGDTAGQLNFTVSGVEKEDVVTLLGKTVDETTTPISQETPVDGLNINVKSHVYPTTGVGLVSSTLRIELENTTDDNITELGTTSSDLTMFSLSGNIDGACDSILKKKDTCTLGYVFKPRSTNQSVGYISIYDSTIDDNLTENQIIQVTGKGALFNEYLSFGVVGNGETKTLFVSLTNDGLRAIELGTTEIEEYKLAWKNLDKFAAIKATATTSDIPINDVKTGNRTQLLFNFFNQDNFTITKVDPSEFTIMSSECSGARLDPGASCLVRVSFKPMAQVNPDDELANHYRAYINFKGTGVNSTKNIDRLHVIGSTQDNSTMYMFPHQDINEDMYIASTTPFEDNESVGSVTLENQFVVIGNDMYSYLGTNADNLYFKGDNKLRKYDASRNKWVILNPVGDNPLNRTMGDNSTNPARYPFSAQSKMIAYDGKLYVMSFNWLDGTKRFNLYSYDPNFGDDGKWTNLGNSGSFHNHTLVSLSAYKGKLYLFGGADTNTAKLTVYDIATAKWSAVTKKGTKEPRFRMAAASIIVEVTKKIAGDNQTIPYLLVHGGATAPKTGSPTAPFIYGLNDLWAFELPYTKGKEIHTTATTYNWTELQKDTERLADGSSDLDPTYIENRPSDRATHIFDYSNGKLILSPGLDSDGYNKNKYAGAHNGAKGNYYTLDTKKLFLESGKNCGTDSAGVVCSAFDNYTTLNTDLLNMHIPATLSGDLWFHNWNILGVHLTK